MEEVRKDANECERCHRFFMSKNGKAAHGTTASMPICPTCSDMSRDASQLMVVARDSDFESVEKSGAYRGLYFVLGGTVPILDKEPEKRIRLNQLLERASAEAASLKEIILSLNTTPEGENTADIVRDSLKSQPAKITVLGKGLSTGAELEYVDADTIRNALQNRH